MTGDSLTELLAAMRGVTLRGERLDFSAEDVADAIWLAPHLVAPDAGVDPSGDEAPAQPAPENITDAQAPADQTEPDESSSVESEFDRTSRLGGRRGELYLPAAGGSGRGGRPLRAPTGTALPGSLALGRAMRPLRRRVPSRTRRVLDVPETVRRVAEEGVWLPALRPARDRWLDLALVVDSGSSMGPWRSTATELLKLLSCVGAFRTVRIWNLETDSSPPRLRAGLVPRSGALERDPRELVDPAGRSLVLVLTDCVAESWYDGGAAKLLQTWSETGPVGLLMVLPEHLWPRTALGTAAAVRVKAPHAAASNARLEARLVDFWADLPDRTGAPVPVASLTPEALTSWARLVSGAGGAESAGFLLDRNPSPRRPPAPGRAVAPAVQLTRFWRSASPTARRLAGLLAASPVISLPVIRLVRQALLPEARQVHEAEVLLGNLLRVVTVAGEVNPDPDEIRYEFRDGLRSLLLDAVPTVAALSVLEQVSSFVEEHLESGIDFRAVLADPAAARGSLVADESPFARVAAEVLLRLGGDYAKLVAALPVDAAAAGAAPAGRVEGFPSPPGRLGGAPPLEDPPLLSTAPLTRTPSVREKFSRVRRPRTQITYEVESEKGVVARALPFVVGVLGDFSGRPAEPLKPLKERRFIQIDRDNFDEVMARMTPELRFRVADTLKGDGSQFAVRLKFDSLEAFEPGRVLRQFEPLLKLRDTRDKLRELLTRVDNSSELESLLERITSRSDDAQKLSEQLGASGSELGTASSWEDSRSLGLPQTAPAAGAEAQEVSILDQVLAATKHSERPRTEDLLRTFVQQLRGRTVKHDQDVFKTIHAAISSIDENLSRQLAAIMHHPRFQKLEATWRGLHYLVMNTETSETLKIRMLNVSKQELVDDFDKAVEFDQSQIFKLVYDFEYGTPWGEPFGAIVGDYEFTNDPEDVGLLGKISNVAAAAFCPFITAADPKLFGFESWQDLTKPRDLAIIFSEGERYMRWKSFRDSEDSRFISLVLPRVLARLPYGAKTTPIEDFGFEEVDDTGPVPDEELAWMNAAYLMGARLTDAFAKYGSCTAIQGLEGGGKVEGLPGFIFTERDGEKAQRGPVEIGITDRREGELSRLGFLPLCHYKNTDFAVFFGGQTAQRPRQYDRPEATAAAAIAARLPCVMATSRFAQYLKVIAREKIGLSKEASEVEKELNRWIKNYVDSGTAANQEAKALYPLLEAKVSVVEIPGQPGSFNAILWVKPRLETEELIGSLRMVASIPRSFSG